MSTAGKIIECRAAVAWEPNKPLSIETISVEPPKAHEVRVKICYTAVCHTDLFTRDGQWNTGLFPFVPGHEGVGIVESIGEGVEDLAPGDHVMPLPMPQCRECIYCLHPEANTCNRIQDAINEGAMQDGTSRFTCKGKKIKHFLACSTFSEYTVVPDIALAKISPKAPLDTICIMGCGFPTGYGSVVKACKVKPGSVVAVLGLGAIGLAAVVGAKAAGAKVIVAIDRQNSKAEIARKFGATEFVNPQMLPASQSLKSYLLEKYPEGFEYTFECVGDPDVVREAFDLTRNGYGVTCVIGCCTKEAKLVPQDMIYGRTVKGAVVGGYKSRDEFPKLVEDYLAGKIPINLEDFITNRFDFSEIGRACDILESQERIRSVLKVCDQ